MFFFNSWRDRRFKADGQKEAGNYEAGGEETGPPQGLGGHRGCHKSQDRARLPHQCTQSQLQMAKRTQDWYVCAHKWHVHFNIELASVAYLPIHTQLSRT